MEIGVQQECRTARFRVALLGRSWDGQTAAGKGLHKSRAEQLLYYCVCSEEACTP